MGRKCEQSGIEVLAALPWPAGIAACPIDSSGLRCDFTWSGYFELLVGECIDAAARNAKQFFQGKPIELMSGKQLLNMARAVQREAAAPKHGRYQSTDENACAHHN